MALPKSVPADGNLKVTFIPTLAIPATPSAAALNGAGAVDLSCYLTPDGLVTGGDEAVVNDDRLCSVQTFEQPGRFTDTLSLVYIWGDDTDNEAYESLPHLTEGYIVLRWGKPYDGIYAVADEVDVYPVTAGKQMKQPPEANSVLKTAQKMFVTGSVERDVAVIA